MLYKKHSCHKKKTPGEKMRLPGRRLFFPGVLYYFIYERLTCERFINLQFIY